MTDMWNQEYAREYNAAVRKQRRLDKAKEFCTLILGMVALFSVMIVW